MNDRQFHDHLSAEQIQAFLDGELPQGELSAAEEHLAVCARCSAEMDAWSTLFADLGELVSHTPREGFADRVISAVATPP